MALGSSAFSHARRPLALSRSELYGRQGARAEGRRGRRYRLPCQARADSTAEEHLATRATEAAAPIVPPVGRRRRRHGEKAVVSRPHLLERAVGQRWQPAAEREHRACGRRVGQTVPRLARPGACPGRKCSAHRPAGQRHDFFGTGVHRLSLAIVTRDRDRPIELSLQAATLAMAVVLPLWFTRGLLVPFFPPLWNMLLSHSLFP